MPDNKDEQQTNLDRLLASPPSEVMIAFQHDLRGITGNIEGWTGILAQKEFAHEQDRAIEGLKQSVKKARDAYDYILSYLEKLQDVRQSPDAHP